MPTASRIALVTGGSRGLGKNMALSLARQGSDVVVTYVSKKEAAQAVVSTIEDLGCKAAALPLDVGDIGGLDAFAAAFKQCLADRWDADGFDILVNNAGIGATIPFEEATEADFDRFMNIHPELNAFIASQTALGRAGQADDIGGVAAFLASEEARWITGQRIEVSGGMFL